MKQEFTRLKSRLAGTWNGEGFAKFPTIDNTDYTETWIFEPDSDKMAIRYKQKTRYKNSTPDNGKTVFWDTGFIILKEDKILLVSAQVGGRVETYELSDFADDQLTFNSLTISNDNKTIHSQRVIHLSEANLSYELNMSTHVA